jgi:hypothetical protein
VTRHIATRCLAEEVPQRDRPGRIRCRLWQFSALEVSGDSRIGDRLLAFAAASTATVFEKDVA